MQSFLLDPSPDIEVIQPEDDMPLNETDRAWIREAIRDAHKRSGVGKVTGFVKDWGGTSAAAAILILIFTQWNGYVEFRTHTGDRLDTIERGLHDLQRLQVTSDLNLAEQQSKAGQKATASVHLHSAAELLQTLASSRAPAPPSFFQQSVEQIDQLSSSGLNNTDVHQTLVKLAEL